MKRLIFLFLFIFLLATTVYGAGLSFKATTVDNLIMVDEEALFDITVVNEQTVGDRFTFVISDLDWEWNKQYFDIAPGKGYKFSLKLKAREGVIKPDRYSLNLKVYSTTNENVYAYEPLLVTVFDESRFFRIERIDHSLDGLDPEKRANGLTLIVKNQYDNSVGNVDVILSSKIFDTVKSNVDFDKAELKKIDFEVKLNSGASEGLHDVNIVMKKGDQVLINENKKVSVREHSDVKEDKEITSGFLVKRISVSKINQGSSLSKEVYRMRLSSMERLFSESVPKPLSVEKSGDDYYYIWNFDLSPGNKYDIYVEINYRDPLMIFIAFIIIIYLVIYLTESGVSIKKRALTIKSREGITSMKILLMIRNRGKREIKNLRVVDQLFNLKNVPSDYGTLRPSKISRRGDDVVLVWDNINFIGKEERIFSYRVNMEVKNKLVLPRAVVRYKFGNRFVISRSNSCLVVN